MRGAAKNGLCLISPPRVGPLYIYLAQGIDGSFYLPIPYTFIHIFKRTDSHYINFNEKSRNYEHSATLILIKIFDHLIKD